MAELMERYETWERNRRLIADMEEKGETPDADAWYNSDIAAVDLLREAMRNAGYVEGQGSGECECDPPGILIEQTYGRTNPPAGSVLIQRCDLCEHFEGDVDAALAYAKHVGGRAHVIGDGEMLAYLSDPWIRPFEEAGPVVWHAAAEAAAVGWYETDDEEDLKP